MAYGDGACIDSLPTHLAGPADVGGLIRGRWGIENRLRWLREATWNEDRSQVRRVVAPQVTVTFRRRAVTLLKQCGHRKFARARRRFRNQPATVLAMVGFMFARRLCRRPCWNHEIVVLNRNIEGSESAKYHNRL
ncbi:hypothetical protein CIK74_18120 [Glutamicibacter sp. BW77]|nr:hypothetical protein CIK74_18120 [Glutamicibacter sp. BW77]